jgi:hypothetical protein
MALDESHLWAVVPCMGRLDFLQQTLPVFFRQPLIRYCLVDYSCPQRAGEWAERECPSEVRAGRLAVERITGEQYFHKSRAHNAGARRAMRDGATHLCFMDADTIVRPDFGRWVADHFRTGKFLIAARAAGGKHVRSTGGLLVVSAADFVAAGRYDEAFIGWGCEDVEIRLRLHLASGLEFDEVPLELLHPIQHSDGVRGRFQRQGIRETEQHNRRIVEKKVKAWTGATTAQLGPRAKRLLMGRIWNTPPISTGPSRWVRRSWR